MMNKNIEQERQLAAKEAVKYIRDNQIVGLGTGGTASYAIREIGEMVKKGLRIQGIPTSDKTRELAESLNIPLVNINTVHAIDITIDGADEFDENLVLIKGGGGALLREKIVASLTREEIIIADSTKKVDVLGKFKLPVEIIPFASSYVLSQIKVLKGEGKIRMAGNVPFITDQGNHIIDADFGLIQDPVSLSDKLNDITGVVEHGLFINLANKIIMGNDDGVIVFARK